MHLEAEGPRRLRRTIGVALTALSACFAVVWTACRSFGSDNSTDRTEDAGVEGAAPDAPSADSPIGDAPIVDAGGPGCTPDAHTFCEDFENDPLTSGLWTGHTIVAPGDLVQSTERAHSGTHSALITIAPDAGNGKAFLVKEFPFPVLSIACEFWFYGDSLRPGSADSAGLISYEVTRNAGSVYTLLLTRLYVASDGSQLSVIEAQDGGVVTGPAATGPALSLARWSRVRLEMGLQTPSVVVKVDGKTLYITDFPLPAGDNNGFTLAFGVNDTAKASRFFVDDLACDLAR